MELENAWKKFVESGSPLSYIEYSCLKQQKEKISAFPLREKKATTFG